MKTSYLTLIISILLLSCGSSSINPKIEGFKMPLPENWYDNSDLDLKDNLAKYDLEEEKISKLLKSNKGSVPVVIYTKYDPATFNGPIPTIQVLLRSTNAPRINAFKEAMTKSLNQMSNMLPDFKILSPLEIIKIDGFEAVKFVSQFNMPLNENETSTIRSWTYAIPSGKHFYQINFSDMENENCENLYADLIKQLKLRK